MESNLRLRVVELRRTRNPFRFWFRIDADFRRALLRRRTENFLPFRGNSRSKRRTDGGNGAKMSQLRTCANHRHLIRQTGHWIARPLLSKLSKYILHGLPQRKWATDNLGTSKPPCLLSGFCYCPSNNFKTWLWNIIRVRGAKFFCLQFSFGNEL